MKNAINNPKFFELGKSIFTISNNKGVHYTFKIRKRKDSPYFISLLTGPENTSDYTYLGLYIPQYHDIKLTAKSKMNLDSLPVKVFRWGIKQVVENKELPEGYSIVHEGKCGRCGRRLTTPESIERGVGPECWRLFATI